MKEMSQRTDRANGVHKDKNISVSPAAEETGCDASGAAPASQVLQDLSDHVGKQWRHHQQTVRWHSSA